MAVKQQITLSQANYRFPPVIHAVCGDAGRLLWLKVDDVAYTSQAVGVLHFTRPDGSYYSMQLSNHGNSEFYGGAYQTLTRPGVVKCQLKVTENNAPVSTYDFHIIVHESPDGVPEEQLGYSVEDIMEAAEGIMGATLGQPVPVTLAAGMDDQTKLYLYLGSEAGYSYGHVYAYINGAWTDTGLYGTAELPFVTPEMYGAAGDGITDDTAAFNAAVAAAATAGQYVMCGSGKSYHLTGEVAVSSSCIIDGAGCTVVLDSHEHRTHIFYVTADGVVIRNFRAVSERQDDFENGETNPVVYTETKTDNNEFVHIRTGNNGVVENITTSEVGFPVFFGFSTISHNWKVRSINAEGALFGVHVSRAEGVLIEDCDITLAPDANQKCHCVYINDLAAHVQVRNCKLTAILSPESSTNLPNFPLVECHVNTSGNPNIEDVLLDGLVMYADHTYTSVMEMYAFHFDDSDNIRVTGCDVTAPRLANVSNTASGVSFSGVEYRCIETANAGDYSRVGNINGTTETVFRDCGFSCPDSTVPPGMLSTCKNCTFLSCRFDVKTLVSHSSGSAISFTGMLKGCIVRYNTDAFKITRPSNALNIAVIGCHFEYSGTGTDTAVLKVHESGTGTPGGNLILINNTAHNAAAFTDSTIDTIATKVNNNLY